MTSVDRVGGADQGRAVRELDRFRGEFFGCLGRRADELFELLDALLCAEGPVSSLVGLRLAPEHRRGHGALYAAVNRGELDTGRLRETLGSLPLPRMFGGRIVRGVDVSPWLRPDAPTCSERLFCHVYGRGRGRDADQRIPGWPYQLVAALESGPTSWTAVLDVVRLGPADDATAVTAAQLRGVIGRLQRAGHWRAGDPAMLVVLDSGYDVHRLAFVLADLPIQLIGRIRADRVLLAPAPPRSLEGPGPIGRPRGHGAVLVLAEPRSWPTPSTRSVTATARYGPAHATPRNRMDPRLAHRGPSAHHSRGPPHAGTRPSHPGGWPPAAATPRRRRVAHLPGRRKAKPIWLWSSTPAAE